MCLRKVHDRESEVFNWKIDERHPLDMRNIDNVEGDIDAPHLLRRFVGMLLDRLFVERVDLSGVGDSSGIGDLLGQRVDLFKRATGQADHRSFTDEGMSHCAADRASRSVNHGTLVFKQHMSLPPVCLASLCVKPESNREKSGQL